MTGRDRNVVLGLAGFALALTASTLLGVPVDAILIALPAFVVTLPLLAGRFVGEERIARLAAAYAARRRRPQRAATTVAATGRPRRVLPRGGRLLAAALAVRPPPARLRMTA